MKCTVNAALTTTQMTDVRILGVKQEYGTAGDFNE